MPGSKVVVNHQVMLRGATSHGAVGRSRLLYIANRPGAVALKTDDDLRIERENERMAKLGYVAFRPGSVAEPNAGHALFDAHGVPVRAEIQRELKETESAIITSVVSVRREDAAELGLSTKQDWERLLRSQWPNYVESLGVMAPENVRWVAAYHIGDKSGIPHCHVFTWDASGQFDSLLPKQRMARANDDLRAFLLKPQREELSLVRAQARDELVSSMRNMQLTDGQVRAIAQALPAEGSLKYAKLAKFHPDAVKPVDEAVAEALKSNADMAAVAKRYRAAVVEHGELKGLTGDALQAHIAAADADLRTRPGKRRHRQRQKRSEHRAPSAARGSGDRSADRGPHASLRQEGGAGDSRGARELPEPLGEEVPDCRDHAIGQGRGPARRVALGAEEGSVGRTHCIAGASHGDRRRPAPCTGDCPGD